MIHQATDPLYPVPASLYPAPRAVALEPHERSLCEVCEENHPADYDLSHGWGLHVAVCTIVLEKSSPDALRFELGERAA